VEDVMEGMIARGTIKVKRDRQVKLV
jgi:hypothetical protein